MKLNLPKVGISFKNYGQKYIINKIINGCIEFECRKDNGCVHLINNLFDRLLDKNFYFNKK